MLLYCSTGKVKMKKLVEYMEIPLVRVQESEGDANKTHWRAPIWQLDKLNLNGRVYSTKLAQRIVAEGLATGACDGHDPDYHRDFGNYKAVVKNPVIEDGKLYVDIYFVDEVYQAHIAKLSEAGLAIGVSSVGYGETDVDGVVNADTYRLVRYLDFVSNPAGEVYAKPAKENEANDESKTESEESTDEAEDAAAAARKAKVERYRKIENVLRNSTGRKL